MVTPLRIALISMHTSPGSEPGTGDAGGMNVVVREQALALGRAGHRVDIVTRRSERREPEVLSLAPNVRLITLVAGPIRPVAKGDHEELIDEFSRALSDAYSGFGPWDIIHSQHWFSGMAALPVARQHHLPHVMSFHSIAAADGTPLSDGERAESPGRLDGEALLASASDAVVTVSESEARTVLSRLGGEPDRIRVVLPGVDTEVFHPGDVGQRGTAFVVAARLHPLKGVTLAVEALGLVPSNLDASLVIAGEGSAEIPDYRAQIDERATQLGIVDRVRYAGALSRADLAELFRGARGVLIPSHSETFGLVATEASASGTPVIAAGAGGLPEAVTNGVTGIVIPDRDPGAWAAAMVSLLSDDAVADSIGAAGRRRACTYTWESSAARLAEVYVELLATHERTSAHAEAGVGGENTDPRVLRDKLERERFEADESGSERTLESETISNAC